MLRSSSSSDAEQELVRSANANVGLVADDIWKADDENEDRLYRRLNRRLWTRSCKIAENYGKLGSAGTRTQRRVRDVIPESRLASYGDFEYEDESELLRAVLYDNDDDDDDDDEDEEEKPRNGQSNDIEKVPWMLDEVEEYLARIADAAGRRRRSNREQVTKRDETLLSDSHKSSNQTTSVREDRDKTTPPQAMRASDDCSSSSPLPRFSVTNVSEAQLEGRIFNESVRNLWRSPSPAAAATHSTLTVQQQQLHRGLRNELHRELGLLRPQSRANNDVQQTHSNFQTERLRMPRSHYPYMQPLNPLQQQQQQQQHRASLCVEVPEFFPTTTTNNNKNATSWPTTTENPYQDEMFAYKTHVQTTSGRKATLALYQNLVPMLPTPIVSAMVWPPAQTWAQRILPTPIPIHQLPAPTPIAIPQPTAAPPPPMCQTVVHRPIRLPEPSKHSSSTSHKHIPVYQRTTKVNNQEYPQRRKSQGVDFNNLILLTKSAMKVRKTQTKPARKSFAESAARMGHHVKADGTTTRWMDKGCQQKREREFVTVPTSHPKPHQTHHQDTRAPSSSTTTSSNDEEDNSTRIENIPSSRKRLYREVVLDNSNDIAESTGNSFEKRYDELERQAMEQYRTSEECLALRYQELEQQALEQYRTAESTESINESGRSNRRNDDENERVDNVNDNDTTTTTTTTTTAVEKEEEDNDSGDGKASTRDSCSSGFGKCNSPDRVVDEKEKKADSQQQPGSTARIRILRAEVQRAASEGSLRRPIAVARRLPQGRSQKNTDRGASDDNTVKASSSLSSLKRRLMPMSPLDRMSKSGGCPTLQQQQQLPRNHDPVKAAVQTLDKHVAAYYRNNNNVSQTGSGDAKVNGTAVWLSDFWS